MGNSLVVKVRCALWQQEASAEGKGVHREVESERSLHYSVVANTQLMCALQYVSAKLPGVL